MYPETVLTKCASQVSLHLQLFTYMNDAAIGRLTWFLRHDIDHLLEAGGDGGEGGGWY